MNENKYYLKVDNRTVAECIPLEYALIFISPGGIISLMSGIRSAIGSRICHIVS